ncbi:MAG: TraB family protein [Nanoarchaeota archaeon]|nr:TraB family protein [Nanoarchaeota archaeon]
MLKYKGLYLIGTSHIAVESIKEVVKAITVHKPQIVALELDEGRFYGLMHKKRKKPSLKDIYALGVKAFIFTLIGAWVENKLGKVVGTSPGDEMKAAAKVAKECNAEIALIDRDIRDTLKSLFRQITWKEKFRFLWDLLFGVFSNSNRMAFDLRKVPDAGIITKMISHVRKRYPSVYNALIAERNTVMAKHLYNLMVKYDCIVAVVGAGHEAGIIKEIKSMEKTWNTQKTN